MSGSSGRQHPRRRLRKGDLPRDRLGRLRPPGAPDEMAHLRDLPERVGTPEDAAVEAVALFDDERFFEAFKHFVAAWQQSEAPARKDAYRALAQAAAGCCHIQRGNRIGAEAVLGKATAGLGRSPDVDVGVDLLRLRAQVEAVRERLSAGAPPEPFPRLRPP